MTAIRDFNNEIDTWIIELEKYSFTQLTAKASPTSWSLGQVYMHVIGQTEYYVEQILSCVSNNNNSQDEMSANGKALFKNNGFPDEIIEGPSTNADTLQPVSKEELMLHLLKVKETVNHATALISDNSFAGKTKHPGLHYFNANEWLKFTEMHLRHHQRQKRRIDGYLNTRQVS
ncbi:MAG: DinB family protein [Chitinophagaceae bacterium]